MALSVMADKTWFPPLCLLGNKFKSATILVLRNDRMYHRTVANQTLVRFCRAHPGSCWVMVGKHLLRILYLFMRVPKRKDAEKGLGSLNKMSSAVTCASGTSLL